MAWRGSISRSLISTARASAFRSSPPLISAPTRLRPSTINASRLRPRRLTFSNPRTLGELACVQSLMPLNSMAATSHLAINVRAFCELSHGTFRRSCQDR
ncbi:caspase-6 protein [Perilla frutescens var. hirtella]|uniref:Caspase-6 protein n=1 Tax=Perilla frutescens var. hirtella TaxID=608512 RepID=A0AAD4PCP2_PERFH|nr:caspase-6 protein [Perilla frutescens var. hirtella]KAH6811808.1 caspase-6 protein [Perilla frutescens var. frutescens]KAH6834325.1 caspase-6 protein [Perilla frutescens var. hirtella]